jgi:acetyltransferase-like isoleucine patch superfamily enzyme
MGSVASSATISPRARIGNGVEIREYTIVHDNVVLGDGTVVGAFCELGHASSTEVAGPLEIGPGSLIRSHSVLYEGSSFGPELRTGHHVTLREGLRVGRNLQVGTLSDLQGRTTIGDHVRLHSNVHIGQWARIGSFVWLYPYTVLTNDPHPPSDGCFAGVEVGDYAVVATMCCLLPGVKVGTRALVAAHSLVNRDVAPDTVVGGSPARPLGPTSGILLRDGSGEPAYPWMRHFHRGFPPEVVARWRDEFGGYGSDSSTEGKS